MNAWVIVPFGAAAYKDKENLYLPILEANVALFLSCCNSFSLLQRSETFQWDLRNSTNASCLTLAYSIKPLMICGKLLHIFLSILGSIANMAFSASCCRFLIQLHWAKTFQKSSNYHQNHSFLWFDVFCSSSKKLQQFAANSGPSCSNLKQYKHKILEHDLPRTVLCMTSPYLTDLSTFTSDIQTLELCFFLEICHFWAKIYYLCNV